MCLRFIKMMGLLYLQVYGYNNVQGGIIISVFDKCIGISIYEINFNVIRINRVQYIN